MAIYVYDANGNKRAWAGAEDDASLKKAGLSKTAPSTSTSNAKDPVKQAISNRAAAIAGGVTTSAGSSAAGKASTSTTSRQTVTQTAPVVEERPTTGSAWMIRPDGSRTAVNAKDVALFEGKGYTYDGVRTTGVAATGSKSSSSRSSSSSYTPDTAVASSSSIQELIQKMADSQYGQAENNLKQRVADIINKYTAQLGGVEGQYRPMYQQNEQNNYQANESAKATLAKSGLLGSGIEQGYNQQNAFKYATANQSVDLQKQGQVDTINNNINDANRNLGYDLNDLALQKANFINSGNLQEAKDQRTLANENYWKQQEMDLANNQFDWQKDYQQQQLNQQSSQFEATMNYNYDKLEADRSQFDKQLGFQNAQLDASIAQNKVQLAQEAKQFDATMGFNQAKLASDMKLATAQLNASIANSRLDASVAMARLKQESTEFAQSMQQKAQEMGMATQGILIGENNRVDEIIAKLVQDNGSLDKNNAGMILGVINSSALTPVMKYEKINMLNNVLTGGVQPYANPYPSGFYNSTQANRYAE